MWKAFLAILERGLRIRNVVIWRKNNITLSNSDYKSLYEPVIVGWADDYDPIFYGWNEDHLFYGRRGERDVWEVPSVWDIKRTKHNKQHPTMKPVSLSARAVLNSSQIDNTVLDLFGGSGSTLIACEQLDRTCYMMEIDPKYCDVIRKRYANHKEKEKKD